MSALAQPRESDAPVRLDAVRDDRLLRAFVRGQRAAFDDLVRLHQGTVLAVCRRWTREPEAARDLAQRTFIRALGAASRSLRGWKGPGPFPLRAWLLRIAVNLGKNHARDVRRHGLTDARPLERMEDGAASAPERMHQREEQAQLRAALVALSRREREVFTLRIDAGLPFADVAAALGITENNAKVTFHHAVVRLRATVAAAESNP